MHTILIAADQKNKGNISPTGHASTLHSDCLMLNANYTFQPVGFYLEW